jgi:hypothetical protein
MRPHARVMEEPTQIADCVAQQRRCSGPALCSDEHRTWQVYHAQSRFGLRWVPHADSGQPRAAGFELAGFRDRVRRLLAGSRTSRFCPCMTAREPNKVEDGNVREPAALILAYSRSANSGNTLRL